jgi:hypothetical protein
VSEYQRKKKKKRKEKKERERERKKNKSKTSLSQMETPEDKFYISVLRSDKLQLDLMNQCVYCLH